MLEGRAQALADKQEVLRELAAVGRDRRAQQQASAELASTLANAAADLASLKANLTSGAAADKAEGQTLRANELRNAQDRLDDLALWNAKKAWDDTVQKKIDQTLDYVELA